MTQETGIDDLPVPNAVKDWWNTLTGNDPAALLNATVSASPVGGLIRSTAFLTSPGTWKRIGVIAAGSAMVYLGVVLVMSQTSVFKKGVGLATSAVSRGVVPVDAVEKATEKEGDNGEG